MKSWSFREGGILRRGIKSWSLLITLSAILIIGGFFVYNALAAAGITVVDPNGGDYWSGTKNITWMADCEEIPMVNIYYSTDNFSSSSRIERDIDCNIGFYAWDTASVDDSDDYKIKIADSSDVAGVYDISDVDFTIDNTLPTITPPATQIFEATGPLTTPDLEEATATDTVDPDPVITYTPQQFGLGSTEVTWTATDASGNSATATSEVTIKDTTAPIITLNDSDIVDIEYGSDYTDAGATASDIVDGDLTSLIVVDDSVDTLNLGTYTVTYNVVDSSGISAVEVVRTVNVVERSITVTANDQSKIYGEPDPDELTYEITSGSLVGEDEFTGALTRNSGEDVGIYAITQGDLALTDDYSVTFVGADLTINKKDITVTAKTEEKIYGEVDPELTYTFTPTLVGDDSFAGFLNRVAGENVGDYAITQGDLALSDNYTLNYTGANLTINKKLLTITAATDTKEYDADTSSTETPTITNGTLVNGDTATWTQSFDNKNVGINKSLIPDGSVDDGNGGNNYGLTFVSDTTSAITAFSVTASITASDKTYDGTTDADINCSLSGVIGSDDVSCTGGTATFDNKNVDTNKTVTATGLTLSGTDAGNYTVNDAATTQADILVRDLTVTATAENKTYDGTNNVTISLLTDKVGSDDVIADFTVASFSDEYVGEDKVVSVSGISISGTDVGNYNLTNTSASTNANITAFSVTASITASDKTYDGTTDADINCSLSGVIGSDDVSCTGGTATFDNKNVDTNKTVTATGLTLSGTDAGNYTVNDAATTQADILVRDLTVTVVSDTKEYDGNTISAKIPTITVGALVDGDTATWIQSFDNENVGTNKSLIPDGSVDDGNGGNNYDVTFDTDTTGEITTKALTITANNQFKSHGEPDPDELTYEITSGSLVGEDEFTGALIRESGEDVGTYAILRGTLTAGGNYELTYVSGILTIQDTTPPVIEFHGDITEEATSADGAVVTYTNPTATDLVDGVVDVTCAPPSGETFELGETPVVCSATDTAGNAGESGFKIIVQDTTAPVVTNLTPQHTGVTSDATPEISAMFLETGSGVDVEHITIYVDGEDKTAYSTKSSGSVTYTPIIPLSTGMHTVAVDINDMAGNHADITSWEFIVNPSVTTMTVSSNKANLSADGTSHAVITAQILDNGNPVEGAIVNFAATIGDLSDITESNGSGRAMVKLKSNEAGQAVVTASYMSNNGLIQGTVSINFTEVVTDTTAPTATQWPADNSMDVAIDVHPYIDFSEAMDEATLTDSNIQLRRYSDNSEIAVTLDINDEKTRVTLIPESDLDYNVRYYFWVGTGVQDLAGNEADTWYAGQKDDHEFATIAEDEPVTSHNISLSQGWNLISLPLIPDSINIGDILNSISASIDTVKYYDSLDGWLSYKPEVGGTLTTMEDGKGYWMNMEEEATLTIEGTEMPGPEEMLPSYSVVEGWNLIGFKSATPMKSSAYLSGVDYTILYGYDDEYSTIAHPTSNVDKDMLPGFGYWLYADSDGNIVPVLAE